MKQTKHILLTAVMLLSSLSLSAHDFEVDGIYYNITSSSSKRVQVTYKGSSNDEYSNEYSRAVTIPSTVTYNGNTYSVTSIGDYAFYDCSSLTSITIPESVTSIGDYAFYDCSSLTSITIPESVTRIGDYTFYYCEDLESITIPESVTSIGEYAFYYCCNRLNSVTIPASVTSIGAWAFAECNKLFSIEIPETSRLTSIGYRAFYDCLQLTSIYIPKGVTNIEACTFAGCDRLSSITIPENSKLTSIEYRAFYFCSNLTQITIPASVTSIGEKAFEECSSLTSVHISDITAWCNIDFVDEYSNPFRYAYYLYLNGEEITGLTIPEGVTSIGNYAFYGCSNLTDITIPESVTSIGDYAFYDCSSLTSITIPESVTRIGDYAFYCCYDLSSVTIPESVTSIGDYTFYYCNHLITITIPESVTSIGEYAFYRCSNLTKITIPASVTSIGAGAFAESNKLFSIEIPKTSRLTSIGNKTFNKCSSLTSITIPNGVTSIGNSAFSGCSSLTIITIPESVTSIGNYAFYNCNSLKSVICEAATPPTIDYGVFSDNLTIYVPATSIERYRSAEGWSNLTLRPIPEDLSTSKYYRIKNVSAGLYLQVEDNNTNMKLQNKAAGLEMMQVFQLEDAAEGKYYIKAADAGNRYYAHASGWNFNATTNADNKTPFTIALVEGEVDVYTLHQSVSNFTGLAGTDNSAAGSPVYCNKNAGQNGKWTFEALTAEEQSAYVAALTAVAVEKLSNTVLYAVLQPYHSKGATSWAVQEGGQALKSNRDLELSVDGEDARQQFAFVSNDGGTTHYLYHAAEAKFVAKGGSLVDKPVDAIQFMGGAYDNTFVAYFDDLHYINVGGSRQMLINSWSTADGGNSCVIVPVGEFDPTEALKAFESDDTGIDYSEFSNQKTEIIYDLMGRRITGTEDLKGIYIVGGRKVVFK